MSFWGLWNHEFQKLWCFDVSLLFTRSSDPFLLTLKALRNFKNRLCESPCARATCFTLSPFSKIIELLMKKDPKWCQNQCQNYKKSISGGRGGDKWRFRILFGRVLRNSDFWWLLSRGDTAAPHGYSTAGGELIERQGNRQKLAGTCRNRRHWRLKWSKN